MVEKILKDYGLKNTDSRYLMINEFLNLNNPITAEELFNIIKSKKDLNLSTVYRNLNLFLEKDIIKKVIEIDGKVYYQYNRNEHTHHLVCISCKEVIPLDDCPLSELENKLSEKTGYEILSHSLEFRGLCPKCKKARLK